MDSIAPSAFLSFHSPSIQLPLISLNGAIKVIGLLTFYLPALVRARTGIKSPTSHKPTSYVLLPTSSPIFFFQWVHWHLVIISALLFFSHKRKKSKKSQVKCYITDGDSF
ncbi:hypothetical protein B0H10DRAFT_381704 [Mycena sp. CBHHK59/15]|nr:hypothetical protein B0H10DRAFT_381704 [Mycena sp. CBHHK59/15]